MAEGNDHDSLVTLIADVRNLSKGQDDFHKEMKDAMNDLKNNYSVQLASHELRINKLETSKTKQVTLLTVGCSILALLVSLLVYHLFQK